MAVTNNKERKVPQFDGPTIRKTGKFVSTGKEGKSSRSKSKTSTAARTAGTAGRNLRRADELKNAAKRQNRRGR